VWPGIRTWMRSAGSYPCLRREKNSGGRTGYPENHWDLFFVSPKYGKKNEFDRFSEFKSKGIEFEVGDKYLFRQLTGLLIRQSCQACSSKPPARYYNKKISRKTKSKI
jgi:hypothetical protein